MGLVKTRRLAAMHPPSPRLRRTGKQQRAILLRQGYGGLKAGMEVLPTTFAEATAVRRWECCRFHCCQFPIGD